jgi:hypothetical protein
MILTLVERECGSPIPRQTDERHSEGRYRIFSGGCENPPSSRAIVPQRAPSENGEGGRLLDRGLPPSRDRRGGTPISVSRAAIRILSATHRLGRIEPGETKLHP